MAIEFRVTLYLTKNYVQISLNKQALYDDNDGTKFTKHLYELIFFDPVTRLKSCLFDICHVMLETNMSQNNHLRKQGKQHNIENRVKFLLVVL
jgi:hypothetical protein